MMRLSDAFKLAYTKLRTRKLRLFISLFIASILFSVLVVGSLVVAGALKSLDAFSREGFSNRYILSGVYQNYDGLNLENETALIVRAEELEKADKAAKVAAAKRLNIQYDDKTADPGSRAVFTEPSGVKHLNVMSKFGRQALAEQQASNPNKLSFEKFKQQVGEANHFYKGMTRDNSRMESPSLVLIKDGKELYDVNSSGNMYSGGYGMQSNQIGLQTMISEWNLLDDGLLTPFLLKGQDLSVGADGSLPIIASYSAAQETLKLPKLAPNATAQEKRQRLEEVRTKIAGQTFEVCYRNTSSNQAFQQMVQQQQEIKQNTGKPGYTKPELIYKEATAPCQAPVIERDVRSSEMKLYQQHQDEFDRQFGKADQVSQVLKFRIVGVTQDSPFSSDGAQSGFSGLIDVFSTLMASSIGARWVSPMSVKDVTPATKDVFKLSDIQLGMSQEAYFAEYSDASTARTILTTKSCRATYGNTGMAEANTAKLPTCSTTGVSYALNPFGSASLAIDEFKTNFHVLQLWAALIIGVISSVILIGMIGRIIADARKETAVFRATGATRFMIAQIYLAYTLYLVMIMVIIALVLGFAAALWVNSKYSPDASINMALLFNVADLSKQFTFYGLEPYDLGVIALTVLWAALIGAIVPIASNIQRNPIRDMRDE